MMFVTHICQGRKIHQLIKFTRLDRYPEIFSKCAEIKPNATNIMSFGCSTGEECQTLKKYFPQARIVGIDINKKNLLAAVDTNTDTNIIFDSTADDHEEFDVIFCMSVLCRNPATAEIEDCSRIYRFSYFEEEVGYLLGKLKNDGCIVLYNCNFRFCDTKYAYMFKTVESHDEHKSGFVVKFDKNHKRIEDQRYDDCVFVRLP